MIKPYTYTLCFLLFLSIIGLDLKAQDISDKNGKVQVIDGRKFYVHIVTKEETLYGISKKYGVDIKDIVLDNPLTINGLKVGHAIKIPVPLKSIETKTLDGKFFYHNVIAGETYYSLSRQYSVTIEKLQSVNPELAEGLKAGVSIRVPVTKKEQEEQEEIDSPDFTSTEDSLDTIINRTIGIIDSVQEVLDTLIISDDSLIFKDVYRVAIMLPFYLDMNDSIDVKKDIEDPEKIYSRSKLALDFYQGALLALDSMEKQGFAVEVFVYDTDNDTGRVKDILLKEEFNTMDLIIGPLYRSNLSLVVDYAMDKGIEVTAPLITTNRILKGNKYLSKAKPCVQTQVDAITKYVVEQYCDDSLLQLNGVNLVVVHNDDPGEKLLADQIIARVLQMKSDTLLKLSDLPDVKVISFRERQMQAVEDALSIADSNLVIVPSRDQAFVSILTSGLIKMEDEYNTKLFGLPVWSKFHNLEEKALHSLSVHLASSNYIDYKDHEVVKFVKSYLNKFKSYPQMYSFGGFDVTYFYLNALKNYGCNYQSFLPELKMKSLHTNYEFEKTLNGGYENKHVYILRYEDYRLVLPSAN